MTIRGAELGRIPTGQGDRGLGSLGGAAEILGLNHSTVFRRLAALETTVGVRLFERSRDGYGRQAPGEEMIALATTMAEFHRGI